MKNKNEKPNYILLQKEEEIKSFENVFNDMMSNYSNYEEIIVEIVRGLVNGGDIYGVDSGKNESVLNASLMVAGLPVVAGGNIYKRKIIDNKVTFEKYNITKEIEQKLEGYVPVNLIENKEQVKFFNLKNETIKLKTLSKEEIIEQIDEAFYYYLESKNEKFNIISLCPVKKHEHVIGDEQESKKR